MVRREVIRQRLAEEVGRLDKDAPRRVGLVYPSPYAVGMSSLGYQRIYRAIQDAPGYAAERIFLDDEGERPGAVVERPMSYEGDRDLGEFPLLALSVAYELQLAGLVRMLDAAGIPAFRRDRDDRSPLLVAGGPLTFSNPIPLAAYVDAIVMGEAEGVVRFVLDTAFESTDRARTLETLAAHPHVYVPAIHGSSLPSVAQCDDALLPAWAPIRTPNTELRDMFLIETERGCSRGCTYCVMRRTTNGGMRVVPADVVLDLVPRDARRVGLVGAAVSDHPKIIEIVRRLGESGREVGLSSLRPDRLKDEFVAALRGAGHKVLTTALDGASERLRDIIERRGREQHYVVAAERAKKHGMDRLKLYLMIGLPGETEADIDECARFVGELSRILPVALGISPFCAKRNTPLDKMPYAGVRTVDAHLARLRSGLKGRADVRSTSAKWAWVEYVLAQGGEAEGEAVARAVRAGGTYAHYKRVFGELGHTPDGLGYRDAVPPLSPERARMKRLPLFSAAGQ